MDAKQIVAGHGGADDILEIEPSTTRLRAELQVVAGPEADTLASGIEDLLG